MADTTAASTVGSHGDHPHGGHPADPSKRDMLELLAGAGAAIFGASIVVPLVSSMNPAKDVLALSSVEVDLTPVAAGQGIVVSWQGKPIFVRHRTAEEIKAAQDVKLSELPDPAADTARVQAGHDEWLVLIGICTHLGCIPLGNKPADARGEFGGYFCPCHGSQYDTSGRIRKGPAPANLAIPPYAFESPTKIKIG
jgi:ubiquinol-cytochrome c reductase iron-sulfur subunit